MKTTVKVPATIANIGCGFDSFGLALPIYNTITVEETVMPGSGIEINVYSNKQNTENIPKDKTNIVYKAIETLYNYLGQTPNELKIDIKTEIPITRGLGSSASVIIGGLVCANTLLNKQADESVLLSIAAEIEGHPDNTTPALKGGVVISSLEEDGSVVYRKLPWPNEWKTTICIPDFELSTGISRSVLPEMVPLKDAIYNLKKSAMFVEAVHQKDSELMKIALNDRLHQPYRQKLIPGFSQLQNNLKHTKGVLGVVIAGAGPSVLIISDKTADMSEVKEITQNTWKEINEDVEIYTPHIEENGAVII